MGDSSDLSGHQVASELPSVPSLHRYFPAEERGSFSAESLNCGFSPSRLEGPLSHGPHTAAKVSGRQASAMQSGLELGCSVQIPPAVHAPSPFVSLPAMSERGYPSTAGGIAPGSSSAMLVCAKPLRPALPDALDQDSFANFRASSSLEAAALASPEAEKSATLEPEPSPLNCAELPVPTEGDDKPCKDLASCLNSGPSVRPDTVDANFSCAKVPAPVGSEPLGEPVLGAAATTVVAAAVWSLFFSSLSSSKSSLAKFWHCIRSFQPGKKQATVGRVWPMPVPFPSLHRPGANRGQKHFCRKLGLNALILSLSWLSLGGPSIAPASLALGNTLTALQWQVVRRLSKGISAWNEAGEFDASAMGRSCQSGVR